MASRRKKTEPTPAEKLEHAIFQVAEGFRKITESDLTEEAIVLLIQHAAGGTHRPTNRGRSYRKIAKRDIIAIMEAGSQLDQLYLKSCQESEETK